MRVGSTAPKVHSNVAWGNAPGLEFGTSFGFSTRIGQSKHLHSSQNPAAFW